ncbi:MAG TPA: HAD family phosphatase [Steroidobacteraceae bacterium]|jgi:HAD superfamily hydrolase (TIGR01509 family)|nr:HAD family phosphatase [Steroidobacteraceae bacterium]
MKTRVVLFDVGGVLVELGGVDALLGWLGSGMSAEQLWTVWLRSPAVRAFETGRIEPLAFAHALLSELGLTISAEVFLESFATWPTRPYPGALELVASIPPGYQRALLSNSNTLHWPRVIDDMAFGSSFDHCFSSHLTGKIKPDREAFEHVVHRLGCQPSEILFLDDNQLNVDAARRVGMQAQRARGVEESRLALRQAGVL